MSQSGTQSYVLVPINQIATGIKVIVVDESIYRGAYEVRK